MWAERAFSRQRDAGPLMLTQLEGAGDTDGDATGSLSDVEAVVVATGIVLVVLDWENGGAGGPILWSDAARFDTGPPGNGYKGTGGVYACKTLL